MNVKHNIRAIRFSFSFVAFSIAAFGFEAVVEWVTGVDIPDILVTLMPYLAASELEGQKIAEQLSETPSCSYFWKSSFVMGIIALIIAPVFTIILIGIVAIYFGESLFLTLLTAFGDLQGIWFLLAIATVVHSVLVIRWGFGHGICKTLDKRRIREFLAS